ncbi:MAG: MFS transporter [Chloroflexota bacterium]
MNNDYSVTLSIGGQTLIGMFVSVIPSIISDVTTEFTMTGITVAAIGLIFPARAVGAVVGNMGGGIGSDWVGRQQLVWGSALLLALALIFAALINPWILFLVVFVLAGVGQGALAVSLNALMADTNDKVRAWMLNISHAGFGIGAAVSPLVIGWFIAQGVPWRWTLGGVALIWLAYGLLTYRFLAKDKLRTSRKKAGLNFRLLKDPIILSVFLINFIFNGLNWGLVGWMAPFLQESGFLIFFAIATISFYHLASTAGRFACAVYADRFGYGRTLLLLTMSLAVTYPLVLIMDWHPSVVILWVILIGLGTSGLVPISMAYAVRRYPDQSGVISGMLYIGMTLGSMVTPLWTGIIADMWSFQAAMVANYAMIPP